MPLHTKPEIIRLCHQLGIMPSKGKGQNFLVDPCVLEDTLTAARLSPSDRVLEIGSGLGALTEALASTGARVFAVEDDRMLAGWLIQHFAGERLIKVVCGDVLKISNAELSRGFSINRDESKYSVVANIPYAITSRLLRKFLEQEPKPVKMILLMQKEVAERIVEKPGDLSILAISVQLFAQTKILRNVSREAFWPVPEVDSALVALEGIKSNLEVETWLGFPLSRFFQIVRIGFSAKRKKLINNLVAGLQREKKDIEPIFSALEFDFNIRAQELSLENWRVLAKVLSPVDK